ncbi:FAD-dependent oxidoreductase [Corynebacterium freneyi]
MDTNNGNGNATGSPQEPAVQDPTAIHASGRAAWLEELKARAGASAADGEDAAAGKPVDLLVIGGGITGAGVALDAVTRGLDVVLVEKHDLGFGTSRWSSKLAHGGLRYLTKLEVGIAYHSAVERGRLMQHIAPHLVRALPQVTPLADDTNLFQKAAVRMGYIAGDMLRLAARTPSSILPRSRYLNRAETLKMVPSALRDGLRGAWVNHDGQMIDDARMVTAIARTAAAHGARVITRCAAVDATGDGATLVDELTGESFHLPARAVVNATGVWAGGLDEGIRVRPSRGTHLVLDAETFGNPTGALTIPLPGSISRYLFILPAQLGRVYLGLTDDDTPGEIPDVPPTPEEDVLFLLENINRALGTKITRDDVRGAFTGLRPLLVPEGADTEIVDGKSGDAPATADLSRRHATVKSGDGLISIVGGKFTEYRLMAQEAVDFVLEDRGIRAADCRTMELPLVGAPAHPLSRGVVEGDLSRLPDSLVARFGHEAPKVVAAATVDEPLGRVAGLDVTRAEFEYAVTHEGALTVGDIVDRRTRIGLIAADREAAAPFAREVLELHGITVDGDE